MFTRFTTAFVLASTLAFAGCAAQSHQQEEDDPTSMQSESALSAYGELLVGDYKGEAVYPRFSLNKDGTYSWDTGIRCITTPCPSGDRGTWAIYVSLFTGTRYVNMRSTSISRWFRVASTSPATLVGAFGTSGTYTKIKTGGCTLNSECARGEQCDAGACVARPLCVQVDAADGRFLAKNFSAGQYAEADAWAQKEAGGGSYGISLANCAIVSTNMACTEEYAPVCAYTAIWNEARTFSNKCDMKRAVIGAAGEWGEVVAAHKEGACTKGDARCSTYWLKEDEAAVPGAYYVRTVYSDFEAKAWIQVQPNAVNGAVLNGACHDFTICTEEYNPVCGGVRSDSPSTFGNVCSFQAAVRASSATEGWSKGYVSSAGACTP